MFINKRITAKIIQLCEHCYKNERLVDESDFLRFFLPFFIIATPIPLFLLTIVQNDTFLGRFILASSLIFLIYLYLTITNYSRRSISKIERIKQIAFFYSCLRDKRNQQSYLLNILNSNFSERFLRLYDFSRKNKFKDKSTGQTIIFCTEDIAYIHRLEEELNSYGCTIKKGKIDTMNSVEELRELRKQKASLILREKELVSKIYAKDFEDFKDITNKKIDSDIHKNIKIDNI